MKSRRDFLTALGLGAGALSLGFPGTTRAGWRWRRHCAPPCPSRQCVGICECLHSQQCDIACPQYLYTYANGVYYYYCACCNTTPTDYVIVPSSVMINCDSWPVTCNTTDPCYGYCFNLHGLGRPPQTHQTDDCAVVIHQKLKFQNPSATTDPPPSQWAMGPGGTITPLAWDALEDQIRGHATQYVTVLPAKPTDAYYVQYTPPNDTKQRTVALYDITHTGNDCHLRIGQEVASLPSSPNLQQTNGGPVDNQNLPHYHQVTNPIDKNVYHVAVGAL